MNDPNFSKFKDKSFHLDNYCFDSKPEKAFYKILLEDGNNDKVYFTGMLTHGQTDFLIHYIDPDSHTLRSYYPDFLSKNNDGSYSIFEVKADSMVDDRVVRAKAEYANNMAVASGMLYKIVKQSEIYGKENEGAVQGQLLFLDDFTGHEYKDALPVYSLKAACGKFGEGQDVEPLGWVDVPAKKGMSEGWFVIQAVGKSMESKIPDNSYCVFKPVSAGTKNGKILLVQHHDINDNDNDNDNDTGGSYTLKKYYSLTEINDDGEEQKTIELRPLNRDYEIMKFKSLDEDYEGQFMVVGEFVKVL